MEEMERIERGRGRERLLILGQKAVRHCFVIYAHLISVLEGLQIR